MACPFLLVFIPSPPSPSSLNPSPFFGTSKLCFLKERQYSQGLGCSEGFGGGRHTEKGRNFLKNCAQKLVREGSHSIVNMGGIVKTVRLRNSLSCSVFSTAGSFGYSCGAGMYGAMPFPTAASRVMPPLGTGQKGCDRASFWGVPLQPKLLHYIT